MKSILYRNKNKFLVLGDQVMVSAASFLTNLLLARYFGPAAFGSFSWVILVQLFFLSISMGLVTQVFQVVYPALDQETAVKYLRGVTGLLLAYLLLVVMVLLLLFACIPVTDTSAKGFVAAALVGNVLFILQDFIRKILFAQQRFLFVFIADACCNVLQLLILLGLWYCNQLTIATAIAAIGLTYLPFIVPGWRMAGIRLPDKQSLQYAWQVQRSKAGWMVLSNLLQWSSGYFFVLAAGWWISPAALGALRLVQYLFGLLNILLQAIENYVLPKTAVQQELNKTYLLRLLKKMLLIILPILVALSLFSRQVLMLMGGATYGQYYYLMIGLSIIYLIITIGYPVRIYIRVKQLNRQYFTGYLLAMIFTVSTAQLLLKNWQLSGVLAGMLVVQCIIIGYWAFVLFKKRII